MATESPEYLQIDPQTPVDEPGKLRFRPLQAPFGLEDLGLRILGFEGA